MAVYPSVYHGGFVDLDRPPDRSPGDRIALTNIVCQTEYSHLSPEELRFRDLDINSDPAQLSDEETRPLDKGLTSVPQFVPPTPAPAFSFSSVESTPSGAVPDSGSGSFEFGPTVDGESATSTCSLCAARLEADAEESEATAEGSGRQTFNFLPSDAQKWSRVRGRVRRLEKTVEDLSHALTELKDTRGHTTSSSAVDALSTALSGLSTEVDRPDSTSKASPPDAIPLRFSEQPDPTTQPESTSQQTSTMLGAPSGSGESISESNIVATENHGSLSLRNDPSPISGLPTLDFMTCPEVFQFLKWAEAHPGLRSTQLFDLRWVSDNLFKVHGGILIYCLQRSFISMDTISRETGSSAWSEDPELMQKLDETYRKHLRPYINTDGSRSGVATVAWESYCFELGSIYSKQFPDWESAAPFFQNLSREYDCQVPMTTASYIEDLCSLWTEVHPALLEVARWLEPFVDYGPDYHRASPLYDATIALGRHSRELFNRHGGIKEPTMFSTMRSNNLMRLLCEHRSGDLRNMQREMECVSGTVPGTAVAALVDRAKQATLWRATEPREAQVQDALARREVRAMMGYRARLLRKGTAAARIRREVLNVLVQTVSGRWEDADVVEGGGLVGEREVFWDGL